MHSTTIMNIITYKKLHHLISFFLLMTILIGEDNSQLSADWVNTSDQSPKKVKAIIIISASCSGNSEPNTSTPN